MTRHARRPIDGSTLFRSTIEQEGGGGGSQSERIKIGGFSSVAWLETAVSVCGPARRGSHQLELVMEEARRPEEAWRSFILYCCGPPHQEDLHPEAPTAVPVRQTLFHIKASFLLCV